MAAEIAAKFFNLISRRKNFVKICLGLMHLPKQLNSSTIKTAYISLLPAEN